MTDKEPYKTLEESEKKVLEKTYYYLENYLNPNRNWDRLITPKQRINRIRYSNVNWKTISDHIKNMEYTDFLKTPYWKAISAHTKYKAGYRCQVCNSAYDLVTHHRNYSIHGFEHARMHELIVLCDICHNKFHGQISKSKLKVKTASIVLIIKLMVFSILLSIFLIELYFN